MENLTKEQLDKKVNFFVNYFYRTSVFRDVPEVAYLTLPKDENFYAGLSGYFTPYFILCLKYGGKTDYVINRQYSIISILKSGEIINEMPDIITEDLERLYKLSAFQ